VNQRLENLAVVFEPKSIAFVGATETKGKWGFIIPNNLINGGYSGKLFPVNPNRSRVFGLDAYRSVKDIAEEVDLALITVPAELVPSAIEDCVHKGIRAGVVITAGFKELGEQGALLEQKMVSIARAGNMVLVGPNGQGVCCPANHLYAWMPMDYHPPTGEVAVVSQSGNIQMLLIVGLARAGFGVSKSASSGNEADIRIDDYIEYFARDAATKVILCYVEGMAYGREFAARARAAALKKPIVIIKGGTTRSGVSAASSHTGAMAVSSDIFDAVCRQSGIVLARRMDEASLLAASFLNRPLPRGKRVAIVTGGGGLGVIAADWCANLGLEVVKFSEKTLSAIGQYMPSWWVPGNPVDLVAAGTTRVIVPLADILMKSGEVDSILFLLMGPPPKKQALQNGASDHDSWNWKEIFNNAIVFLQVLHERMHQHGIPAYVVSTLLNDEVPTIRERLGDKFWMLHPTIETATICMRAMADYAGFLAKNG
jgi:acyl-CoA synthetase (NDP forming)